MPVGTRGKEKENDTLVEKVRQLSPGHSHGSVSSTLTSTPVGTPVRGGPRQSVVTQQHMAGQVDLPQIHQLILEVKNSVDAHKQSVSQEIKKLSANFESHIANQVSKLGDSIKRQIQDSIEDIQQYVDAEVGRITSQIQDIQTRVSLLEEKQVLEYDPEVSVIMSRVPQVDGENIQQVAEQIIHEGLGMPEVPVVRAMRLRQREARPGQRPQTPLVKVQLLDLEAKKRVLRAKLHLGNTQQFSNVWIRSSKPHIERLIDINFRTILDMIPGGNDMTVTNSGRITKRNNVN